MRRHLIYVLIDPRTKEVFYVGRSSSALKRPKRKHSHYCENVRKQIIFSGFEPEICVVQDFPEYENINDVLNDAERYWISYFKNSGCSLTNLTSGGEGCCGRIVSEETRRKLHEKHVGKVFSDEHRENIRLSSLERFKDDKERMKLSLAHLGKKRTPHSEKTKEKIRSGNLGKHNATLTDEHKEKISESLKGHVHDEQSIEKMSRARKEYWRRIRESKKHFHEKLIRINLISQGD